MDQKRLQRAPIMDNLNFLTSRVHGNIGMVGTVDILNQPGESNPGFRRPLNNHQTSKRLVLSAALATIVVTGLPYMACEVGVIIVRIFTRVHISKSFGADDILIVAAAIPAVCCGIITVIAVIRFGWNRHVYDVPFAQLALGLKLTMVVECLFAIGCSLTKLSLLCFTRKITAGTNSTSLKWAVIATMVIVGLEMVVFCLVVVFTCRPISAYWTLSTKPQNCINEAAHILAGGILNAVTDFVVVILPIPTVMTLKLPTRQRVVLCMLFGAGFAVCIAGSVRVYFTYELNISHDKTWAAYPVWISGTFEMYLGVLAASLASLKPFFARYLPTILGSLVSQRYTVSGFSNGYSNPKLNRDQYSHTRESKAAMLESGQTTTITSTFGCDLEFDQLTPHDGVMVSKYIAYEESRNVSKPSFHSTDASSQSELRRA
ncbi:uncharacterized protein GIQ15_04273 [Arthroderma uncinatum]|uniref:uncharacterized protein n=1 Tax=Arthroderma uncinatum TaxID=74035 RepID=UPI00144AD430|nr:uncharacterized protein GIQ15_04273 [Arthroderma uncinatum]KAF3481514.1 integral membrane protein [Arthroderma uncinatum]